MSDLPDDGPRMKMVDGVLKPMTAQEIAELEAMQMPSPPVMDSPDTGPKAMVSAMADLTVTAEGDIEGLDLATGIGFAMALDVNVFWIFFAVALDNTQYMPFVATPGFNADVTDKQPDYFEVTVTDRTSGAPAAPARISISVQRLQ